MDPLGVRSLGLADVDATAALLAEAFDRDPAYVYLFPRPSERPGGLRDFFARNLRTHLSHGCTYVATAGEAVVATVTLRPPDGFAISLLTMIRQGLLSFGRAHGWSAVRRLLALKDAYDDLEAQVAGGERHWHVHMMAVTPQRQGRGLGSTLVREVLARTADARSQLDAPAAVLTTHEERNVVFYERVGFERAGVRELTLPGASPHRVWSMRRPPAG